MNRCRYFKVLHPQRLSSGLFCSYNVIQRGITRNARVALCSRVSNGHQFGQIRSESTVPQEPAKPKFSRAQQAGLAVAATALALVLMKIRKSVKAYLDQPHARIPMLVIGTGVGAVSAAQGARIQDPTAKVAILSEDSELPYKSDLLLTGLWNMSDENVNKLQIEFQTDPDDPSTVRKIKVLAEDENYYLSIGELMESENGGVALRRDAKIEKWDKKKKRVTLSNGMIFDYDKCVVVADTVAKKNPAIEKSLCEATIEKRVTYFKTVDDFKKLRKLAKEGAAIAVVGGNAAAVNLARSLARQADGTNGTKVCQIVEGKGVMSETLPESLSLAANADLSQSSKIDVISQKKIDEVTKVGQKLNIMVKGDFDETIVVDHIVVMDSFVPDDKYADILGVTDSLNTDLSAGKDIWMAGDGITFYDPQTNSIRQVDGDAMKHISGRIAGYNMAGGKRKLQYQPHKWGTFGANSTFWCVGDCDAKHKTFIYFKVPKNAEKPLSGPGVVLYYNESFNRVVGVLLWNMVGYQSFHSEKIARQILKSRVTKDMVPNVAKQFKLSTIDEQYQREMTENDQDEEEFGTPSV